VIVNGIGKDEMSALKSEMCRVRLWSIAEEFPTGWFQSFRTTTEGR